MAVFTGKTTPPDTQDAFLGADDVADVFIFTPASLEPADTVSGGAGTVFDVLQFSASGALLRGAFAGVTGIERLQNHADGNRYDLTQALVASANFGTFEVRGGTGADRVDASAVLDPALAVSFVSRGGADTLTGGAGADRFNALVSSAGARVLTGGGGNDVVTTSAATWKATDIFAGGAGIDRIAFGEAGHVTAAQLAGLSSVEEIGFFSNFTLTLEVSQALVAQAGGLLTVVGGAGSGQSVDAAAVRTGRVHYLAGAGADTFLGSAGDDLFVVQDATSTGDLGAGDDILQLDNRRASGLVVEGGAGYDTVVLVGGGAWDLSGLTGFEELELAGTGTVVLPDQPGLRVIGSEQRDFVTLGGPGQIFLGFSGDDVVLLRPGDLIGAVLHGGAQIASDILRMTEPGLYDFRRAAVSGFERFETRAAPAAAGPSTIFLPNTPLDLLLRHAADVTLGAHAQQVVAGSARADTIRLGAAGQFVEAGFGNDTIIAAPATLGSGTVVAGGGGTDVLRIVAAQGGPTVDLSTGAVLLGVETIELAAPTHLVTDPAGGAVVLGSSGADTVTAGGAGLAGNLGEGDDLLQVRGDLLGPAGGATLDGGAGNDVLRILDDPALLTSLTVPERFTSFERLDLADLAGHSVSLAGDRGWLVDLGATQLSVFGGGGAEQFLSGAALNFVAAGEGNDTIRQTVAPNGGQVLAGGGGDDLIVYDPGDAFLVTTMPDGWTAETVQLIGTHVFTANASAGTRIIGDATRGNAIHLNGNGQMAQGGAEADTLWNQGGLGTTLMGGEGADFYIVSPVQALWDTPGQVILDTATPFVVNQLRFTASDALRIDFHDHDVQFIDRIHILGGSGAVDLTLTDEMAATADGNNDGTAQDLRIQALLDMTSGTRIDASDFAAGRSLHLLGRFAAADTILGGAGADTTETAGGADSIIAGAGSDLIIGGAGGDVIDLGEPSASPFQDRVRYTDINDGTVDIDNAVGVSQATADSIGGFDAALDKVELSRAGLGLGSGGVQAVAANAAWDLSNNAVFLFESDSGLADTTSNNNFADFNSIASGINTDATDPTNPSAGRTVALVMSNPETSPTRATGIYVWTDVDGDGVMEASDVVRLLGVLHGVTATQLAAGSAVQIIA